MNPILASNIKRRVGRRIRVLSEPVRKKLLRIAPRAENDYSTHIPILIALANNFKIRRVLELGSGEFSTGVFLNRSVFRDLTRLDSFETDQMWLDRTAQSAGKDERYHPCLVDEMAAALRGIDVDPFDLILVDDSTSAAERAETIKQLSRQRPKNVLVVIHDFEVNEYREAAAAFEHRQIFRAFTPQTGIVWNKNSASLKIFKKLESQIRQFSKALQPDDVGGWIRALSGK